MIGIQEGPKETRSYSVGTRHDAFVTTMVSCACRIDEFIPTIINSVHRNATSKRGDSDSVMGRVVVTIRALVREGSE